MLWGTVAKAARCACCAEVAFGTVLGPCASACTAASCVPKTVTLGASSHTDCSCFQERGDKLPRNHLASGRDPQRRRGSGGCPDGAAAAGGSDGRVRGWGTLPRRAVGAASSCTGAGAGRPLLRLGRFLEEGLEFRGSLPERVAAANAGGLQPWPWSNPPHPVLTPKVPAQQQAQAHRRGRRPGSPDGTGCAPAPVGLA